MTKKKKKNVLIRNHLVDNPIVMKCLFPGRSVLYRGWYMKLGIRVTIPFSPRYFTDFALSLNLKYAIILPTFELG